MSKALGAYPPQVRALMLEVLTSPDDRAKRIGELCADERSRRFAEVLIDLEKDQGARGAFGAASIAATGKRVPR